MEKLENLFFHLFQQHWINVVEFYIAGKNLTQLTDFLMVHVAVGWVALPKFISSLFIFFSTSLPVSS